MTWFSFVAVARLAGPSANPLPHPPGIHQDCTSQVLFWTGGPVTRFQTVRPRWCIPPGENLPHRPFHIRFPSGAVLESCVKLSGATGWDKSPWINSLGSLGSQSCEWPEAWSSRCASGGGWGRETVADWNTPCPTISSRVWPRPRTCMALSSHIQSKSL